MKVACVGNTNNNMFSLVRWFRDFGINSDLLLFDSETEHFLPQNDSMRHIDSFSWIKKLTWGSAQSFFVTSPWKVRRDLQNYDIIIGCGLLPAFLNMAHLKLHIFAPYGMDLYSVILKERKLNWKTPAKLFIKFCQKNGIRQCCFSTLIESCELYKEAIVKTGVKNIPISMPHLYAPEYQKNIEIAQLKYSDLFLKIRHRYDVVVFNHCRQIWKTFKDKASWKGNDVLINGFAKYLKKARKKSVLVLFEYGVDVKNSKKLIQELEIEKYVIWLPKMPRKEIMFGLSLADFGSDILKEGIGTTANNGTSVEVMMMAKPLFKNICITHEEHKSLTMNRPFPLILNVNTPEAIAKHLVAYEKNPESYKELGAKAKEWFDNYMGIGLVSKWVHLISCIHENKKINMTKLRFD